MLFRRYIVSMLALAGLAAAGSLVLTGAKAKSPVEPGSAQEIAKAWRYNAKAKGRSWDGAFPKDSHKLFVEVGWLDGASFCEVWNFYAQKCGSDKKFGEAGAFVVGEQTKDGEYVIFDIKRDDLRMTTFAFTNQRFIVSVQLRQAPEKDKLYIDITVATH
jgi:hypothetical protein